jgi:hypothetical protein
MFCRVDLQLHRLQTMFRQVPNIVRPNIARPINFSSHVLLPSSRLIPFNFPYLQLQNGQQILATNSEIQVPSAVRCEGPKGSGVLNGV